MSGTILNPITYIFLKLNQTCVLLDYMKCQHLDVLRYIAPGKIISLPPYLLSLFLVMVHSRDCHLIVY